MKRTISQSELNRLAQQLQDLREALKPFAVFADALPPVIPGWPRLTDAGPAVTSSPLGKNYIITFADLRAAKALLDRLETEDSERVIEGAELQMASFDCAHCGAKCLPEIGRGRSFCSNECEEAEEMLNSHLKEPK
jgi:hypothetical protein